MTTVYRLPEEPPVGTTVRPVENDRIRYKRAGHGTWLCLNNGVAFPWPALFLKHPGGLRIVEPDPHPTPWTVSDRDRDGYDVMIFDAAGFGVCEMRGDARTKVAQRIVDAVNEVSSRKAERP